MGNYRTSSVFKFTKDFELLKKILRDGIIPNYCEEDLSFDKTTFVVGIPMASFCDIPITLLDEHNKRYGNYGIALSKEWAQKKGLTPIMYIANSKILQAVYYHHEQNQKLLDWYNTDGVKKKLIEDTVFKGFPLEDYIKILNAQQEHAVNTHIIGYLKMYEGLYRGNPINNYEENEWRYIVPDKEGTEWFWTRDEYMKWRNPNNINISNVKKPSPSESLKKYTLKFELNDISYILIKDDEFKIRLIEFIKNLKSIGGNPVVDEVQMDELISRIITLEQVKRDF